MIQINLVPDVKLELISAQRHRNIVVSTAIIAMIAAAVVVVVLGGVIGAQKLAQNVVTDNIKEADKEFRAMEDIEKTVTVKNQLESIQSTHDQKTMTSRVFDLLTEASAKGTENSVSLTSFSVDTETSTISLLAQTDKRGFEAAEVFRKNLEGMQVFFVDAEDKVNTTVPNEFLENPLTSHKQEQSEEIASEVSLSDLSYSQAEGQSQRTVNFRLSFVYNELLFDGTKDLLRIRGLDRGNVTDSYTRLPGSLFDGTSSREESAQ